MKEDGMDTKTNTAAEEIRMCAFRGAIHMDRVEEGKQPDISWYWTVDPDSLDMCDCGDCVLGQYTGCYGSEQARDILDRATVNSREYNSRRFGFNLDEKLEEAHEDQEGEDAWRYLTECWADEIRTRRIADPR